MRSRLESSVAGSALKLAVKDSSGETTTSILLTDWLVIRSKALRDLVGLDQGAGHHRDAEQDGDRGQGGAQLARRQAAERDQGHRRPLRQSRMPSTDEPGVLLDHLSVAEEEDAVGDRGGARRRG